jgi:zinc-ribbon domain
LPSFFVEFKPFSRKANIMPIKCSNCGTTLPDTVNFCVECGTAVRSQAVIDSFSEQFPAESLPEQPTVADTQFRIKKLLEQTTISDMLSGKPKSEKSPDLPVDEALSARLKAFAALTPRTYIEGEIGKGKTVSLDALGFEKQD